MKENTEKLSKKQAINMFLKLPQEYDYMMISPLEAKKQLKSKYFREKVFQSKGTKCETCGSNKNITIHHKTYELTAPKTLRRLTTYSPKSQGFKSRIERCEAHNRKNSKYLLYADEDHKWQLIERKFPDFFEKIIKNMEVLCWKCHKNEHRERKKKTGLFMPLHSYHKGQDIKTESNTPTKKIQLNQPKKSSNYHERIAKIKEKYSNAYEPWTIEDDELLKKLYNEGKTVNEMSNLLKRQPSAIKSRLGQ